MVYKWKNDFAINTKNVNPEKVYKEIKSIKGDITPGEIVKKAKVKSNELHKCFTWDIKKAAEGFWNLQAKNILGSLIVIDKNESDTITHQIRAFENIKNKDGNRVYINTNTILSNKELLENLFKDIMDSIWHLENKLRVYEEISEKAATIKGKLESLRNEIAEMK